MLRHRLSTLLRHGTRTVFREATSVEAITLRQNARTITITASPRRGLSLKRSFHASSVSAGKIVQFNLSDIGEGIAEVQVKEWHVKVGDTVSQFDNICEVQSDKASVTITSRYDGVITRLYYAVDEIARVGQPLFDVALEGEDEEKDSSSSSSSSDSDAVVPASSAAAKPAVAQPSSSSSRVKALATPAVRRIAMEKNVNLLDVSGSGKDGRVLKEDVVKFLQTASTQPDVSTAMGSSSERVYAAPVAQVPTAQDRQVPIKGYTRIMMKTMAEANKIPHFGYNDEICVDRLVDLRSQLKSMGDEKSVRMSYMPLFIKAASMALLQFPALNASLDADLEHLVYRASHNVCVAMDTPGGLVVPNIKHCEQRSLWEIAAELNRLADCGRREQLKQHDLNDGTFTLSNIGTIGGTYAHPVIFPPQVAIGALGKIELLPRVYTVEGGKGYDIRPSNFVKVSWCADHRVIDGAMMARFSNVWKRYLENPALMIAEMR